MSTTRWASFTGWLMVVLVAVVSGCSNPSDTDSVDDGEAPTPVADLAVTDFTATSVTLTWTATGDDGAEGTATGYDLRYLTRPLHYANWDDATQVAGEPDPEPAGTSQSMTIAQLSPDTTYYFALETFDEEDNRGGPSNVVQQTCFEDLVVTIPDANLEAALREFLNKPTGEIYESDLLTVDELDAVSRGIVDLTGLEECINLGHLILMDNQVTDLSPLADLAHLWHLNVHGNGLQSVAPLAGVTSLTQLFLGENDLGDVSPLADLVNLTHLHLQENQITEIAALASLTALVDLNLANNGVTAVTALQNLTHLEYLQLTANQITDISALAGLTALKNLRLASNDLNGIDALANLTALEALALDGCGISDLAALADLTQLQHLTASDNPIADFAVIADLHELRTLVLITTGISDVSVLSGLLQIEYLHLFNNNIVDIGPLVQNTGLGAGDQLNLQINPLSEQSLQEHIPALEARGVMVTY